MMEKVLYGTDIMPAATHLTTSVLSSAHPKKTFKETNITTLNYGRKRIKGNYGVHIGALSLVDEESMNMFKDMQYPHEHHSGILGLVSKPINIPHDSFDLVIMNPPFTKSTNHAGERSEAANPSFAAFNIPKKVQKEMGEETKRVMKLRGTDKVANMQAGLGTHFMDVADTKLKDGGTLALVVSATFVSGASWKKMRSLLEKKYEDIAVVSIALPKDEDRAFSFDTGMAEVLIVATRKNPPTEEKSRVTYFNIPRRPRSILEAVVVAKVIRNSSADEDGDSLKVGVDPEEKFGHCIGSTKGFSNSIGAPGVISVKEIEVAKTAMGLSHGRLRIPRLAGDVDLPLIQLGILGTTSCGHRSIESSGPFKIDWNPGANPAYPILAAHSGPANKEKKKYQPDWREDQMTVRPDSEGRPKPGRDDAAVKLWDENRARLIFNCDFRLNSQYLGACMPIDGDGRICEVIGGRAWTGFKCEDPDHEFPLALWANTTLGLIAFWCAGTRQQSARSVLVVSMLRELAVPDVRKLTKAQIDAAKKAFKKFSDAKLLMVNQAWEDEARQEIDQVVLCDILGLQDKILGPLEWLRRAWCSEPTVHGDKDTRPPDS